MADRLARAAGRAGRSLPAPVASRLRRLRRVWQAQDEGPAGMADGPARVAELETALADATDRLADATTALNAHAAWLRDLQAGIDDVRIAHDERLTALDRWLTSTVTAVNGLSATPVMSSAVLQAGVRAERVDPARTVARAQHIATVTAWLRTSQPRSDTLVTVVMPTRNRADRVVTAVTSVLAQTHPRLELIVVDDGSTDGTAAALAEIQDPRLRVISLPTRGGGSAARNVALDAATGSLIAYLDDDNTMAPEWLQAVCWAFERWPETDLLYGARIVEDASARNGVPSGAFPTLEWYEFDRGRLERANYIDMNTVAHRAGLPGGRFDSDVMASTEWPLLLALTESSTPLELPVLACYYSCSAPGRGSDSPARLGEIRKVRSRIHTRRPLRVVVHTAMFPLLSETYIHDEMAAMIRGRGLLAFNAAQVPVSPYEVDFPVGYDLEAAVEEHRPDVLFLYWASHALGELGRLERLGVPFALRVHSFDFDPELLKRISDHPLCIGLWTFPRQVAGLPRAHALAPIFGGADHMPVPGERTLVTSVSAGLAKKDWPLLLGAMDLMPDLERLVVVARSNGCEEVVDRLVLEVEGRADPPTLQVNLPRQQVFEALARTSVALYTVADSVPVGMPMSIIEALYAGACVVHPDREELRDVLGSSWRPYRTADDIAGHVREVSAGGPSVEAERAENMRWARERFTAPDAGERLFAEVSAALTEWHLRSG